MKRLVVVAIALMLCISSFAGEAENCVFGKPLKGIPIHYVGYSLGYKTRYLAPLWVSYSLKPDYFKGKAELTQKPVPYVDSNVSFKQPKYKDFKDAGYWTLSLFPNKHSLGRSAKCEKESYTTVSRVAVTPNKQTHKVLKDIDALARDYAVQYGQIWVVNGPIFGKTPNISAPGIAIPTAFYRILARKEGTGLKVVAFKIPQDSGGKPELYLTSVDTIEDETGIDFFHKLDNAEESAIESATTKFWGGDGGSGGAISGSGGSSGSGSSGSGGSSSAGPRNLQGSAMRAANRGDVWVNKELGVYYTSSAPQYGKGEGCTYMDAAAASMMGFKKIK